MNFHILFALVGNLTFVLEFPISQNQSQDLFIFNGVNDSAHFFKENKTFYLYLSQGTNISIYEMTSFAETVIFSWQKFLLNDKEMKLVQSVGSVRNQSFDSFTFLSPMTSVVDNCTDIGSLEMKSTNYWYVIAIVFIGGFILETTGISLKTLHERQLRGPREILEVLDEVQHLESRV